MFQSRDAADNLDRAADYMELHGWTRGTALNSAGEVCLVGALFHTKDDWAKYHMACDALRAYIDDAPIGDYNDTVLESKEQAVQTLRDVAIKTRPDGVSSGH